MTSENHIARAIRELELRRGSEPTPASADAPWKNEIADAVIDGKPEYVILKAYRTLSAQLSAMQAERDKLAAQVYVPGLWRCAKCEFQLMQSTLYAKSGTVGPRDAPGDKCPNCNSPLWRVTERDAGNQMVDRCEAAILEASALRAERDRMREALENLIKAGANEIIHEGRGCTGRYVDAERRARTALEQSK